MPTTARFAFASLGKSAPVGNRCPPTPHTHTHVATRPRCLVGLMCVVEFCDCVCRCRVGVRVAIVRADRLSCRAICVHLSRDTLNGRESYLSREVESNFFILTLYMRASCSSRSWLLPDPESLTLSVCGPVRCGCGERGTSAKWRHIPQIRDIDNDICDTL